jgi:hypothetical protein
MKKFLWISLNLIALPLYAQGILGALKEYQGNLESQPSPKPVSTETSAPASEVSSSSESSSSSGGACTEDEQTSLPLSYLSSLILDKNAKLTVDYNPLRSTLQVSAPDMISNCSSMLEWKLKVQEIENKKVYAVEVKLKNGENCTEAGCDYKVAKVEGGSFKSWETINLKPTLTGFEECLQKSGVISEGNVKRDAIYSIPLKEKFSNINESGKVLFVSHGPSSPLIKAKYGEFQTIDKCDYYENILPEPKIILTKEDEERQRLDQEAEALKNCGINEYQKVSDFIQKYEDYSSALGDLRDRLILEAAKNSAKAFESGKYTDEDLKVISDFERYIVQPKIQKAVRLYDELRTLDGSPQANEKKTELRAALLEIKSLNAKPYFQTPHTNKLVHDGHFEEAVKLNTLRLQLDSFGRMGSKSGNEVTTPEIASERVKAGVDQFAAGLESEKEKYAIRTGEITGRQDHYAGLASRMRQNVQTRTQNFSMEISDEYARVQSGGYCYQYFRNTQKCMQDSLDRIQELQALLQHYNRVDDERAKEYDQKASQYGQLEAEGRRYVASQNGEEAPQEAPVVQAEQPVDTTVPAPRVNTGSYNFEYRPQQQPQPQPQQAMQSPASGWFGGGYQAPVMGQQAYYGTAGIPGNTFGASAGGSYNFQWGGGSQQQPSYSNMGQQGYWQQPYSAYGMYSMYGR